MHPDADDPRSLAAFVRHVGAGVVATVTAQGAPEAAFVGLAALDDGTLIFDSPSGYRKIENLRACDRVAVVVGTDGDVSVQLEGTAFLAFGAERERLGTAYLEQFPGSRALSAGFVVVGVRPTWVRVYDASDEQPVVTEAYWSESDGQWLLAVGSDDPSDENVDAEDHDHDSDE
ncbi:pyridoxamine 5'-phosphate oxidase family protein [Humibacter antri]